MSKGGGGTQTSSTVEKADPWAGQQPYLTDIFGKAQAQYNSGTPSYYPGTVLAPQDPNTLAAQEKALTYANTTAPDAVGRVLSAQNFGLGDVLYADSNPALRANVRGALNPIVDNFYNRILPNIGSEAQKQGAYGGARQGIVESNAVQDLNRALLDTSAKMYSDAYGLGLDTFGKSLALAPQTITAGTLPAQIQDAVGQQRTAVTQDEINAAIEKFNWEQQLPANKLAQYQQLVQGNYGGSGTSTSTSPAARRGGLTSALGGAMTGASLASMMFAGSTVAGPLGAGLGALIGLLG